MPTRQTVRRYGEHPLFSAIGQAQWGPDQWARLKALVDEHVAPDRLELRSWIATNELLIERQWRIARRHDRLPRSTGSLEGKLGEWLAPLRRRAGRWQNVRRLNLVLGLMTLRGRGEAHEARYAGLIRARFEATGQRSHLPAQNELPVEIVAGRERQVSWWRTWHDRDEPSLPRLVRDSEMCTRRRVEDDHLRWLRGRLATIYAAETDRRSEDDIPMPPRGRPKRPFDRDPGSVTGKVVADFPDLVAEWDWDVKGDLDPRRVAAGGRQRIVWRCCLNRDHVWETRVADRTTKPSLCPYHMASGFTRPSRWPHISRGSPANGIRRRTCCAPTRSGGRRAARSSGAARKVTSGRPLSTPGRSRAAAARLATGSKPRSGSRPARSAPAGSATNRPRSKWPPSCSTRQPTTASEWWEKGPFRPFGPPQ